MKRISSWLALAGLFFISKSPAVSFNDVQFWIGSGTNRAALVVEWSTPESSFGSTVPAPVANKSLVWGYRFNGPASAAQMFIALLAADPRFYAVGNIDPQYGLGITGIGYHLGGGGDAGITDGITTNYFTTSRFLTNATVDIDAAAPLNPGDLYWGGWNGPNWENWTELGDAGGFFKCPDRGPDAYWTSTDPDYASSGYHGQWDFAWGLSSLQMTNGSWIGITVAAGPYYFALSAPYNAHKHAPATPDPGLTALVKNLAGGFQGGHWQTQFLSCTNWLYSLERSSDLQNWTVVTNGVLGNGTNLVTTDPAPPADQAFYRVSAGQP